MPNVASHRTEGDAFVSAFTATVHSACSLDILLLLWSIAFCQYSGLRFGMKNGENSEKIKLIINTEYYDKLVV